MADAGWDGILGAPGGTERGQAGGVHYMTRAPWYGAIRPVEVMGLWLIGEFTMNWLYCRWFAVMHKKPRSGKLTMKLTHSSPLTE